MVTSSKRTVGRGFWQSTIVDRVLISQSNGEDGSEKSASAAEDTDSEKGSSKDEAANSIGHFLVSGESYSVTESMPTFLKVKMAHEFTNV